MIEIDMGRIERLAAFSDGEEGGNPAGVAILDRLPDEARMRSFAAEIGYSETAFAAPAGSERWRVRYFAPESEVPFCGHATIALGAALGRRYGPGRFGLVLNESTIAVDASAHDGQWHATLHSPPTRSGEADPTLVDDALVLFGWDRSVLSERIAPARINAGAEHLLLVLENRSTLAAMDYDLDRGRRLMRDAGLVTIMLVVAEAERLFHARNAFASGGVLEDPATGAAAAAFAGRLRDVAWPHGGSLQIIQGEDMGMRSLIDVALAEEPGSSVAVSGAVRTIDLRHA